MANKTGDRVFSVKGRVVQIISPEKQGTYPMRPSERQAAQGKYIVILIDPDYPKKGLIKKLQYELMNLDKSMYCLLLMLACPYKIGEIIETDAVEVLIPSKFLTTEW